VKQEQILGKDQFTIWNYPVLIKNILFKV